MNRRSFLLLSAAAQWILSVGAAEAEPSINLAVPSVVQQTEVWCWLAAVEMLIRYWRDKSPAQCEMIAEVHQLPCCIQPSLCTRAGYGMKEMSLAVDLFGKLQSRVIPAPLVPSKLGVLLRAGYPVAVEIRTGPRSSHAIVVRGIRRTRAGSVCLLINDPMKVVASEVTYDAIADVWLSSLVAWPAEHQSPFR